MVVYIDADGFHYKSCYLIDSNKVNVDSITLKDLENEEFLKKHNILRYCECKYEEEYYEGYYEKDFDLFFEDVKNKLIPLFKKGEISKVIVYDGEDEYILTGFDENIIEVKAPYGNLYLKNKIIDEDGEDFIKSLLLYLYDLGDPYEEGPYNFVNFVLDYVDETFCLEDIYDDMIKEGYWSKEEDIDEEEFKDIEEKWEYISNLFYTNERFYEAVRKYIEDKCKDKENYIVAVTNYNGYIYVEEEDRTIPFLEGFVINPAPEIIIKEEDEEENKNEKDKESKMKIKM